MFVERRNQTEILQGNLQMKIWNNNGKETSVKLNTEEVDMSENKEKYSQLYKELSELIGDAATLKLWEHYQGLNISFPKKLYSNEYVRNFVAENKGKMSTKDIAKAVGLSERRVRQILKEEK